MPTDLSTNKSNSSLPEHFSHVRHMVKNHMSVIIAFAQLLKVESQNKTVQNQELIESHIAKIEQRAKKVVEEIDNELSEARSKQW